VADTPNSFDPPPPPAPEKPAALFGLGIGKIIIAGVALFVVACLIGVVVWLTFFNSGPSSPSAPTAHKTSGSSSATSSSPNAADLPPTDPTEKPLESSFTFRNIFAPTLKQPTTPATSTASSSTSSTSSGSSSTTNVAADTLYLQSIQTTDGKLQGTFIWNGKTYTAGKGDTLEGTPWKVVEINDNSAVMLYGDTEVTISVGQGLSK
jgi:type IV pilus biogenesis protein PilP